MGCLPEAVKGGNFLVGEQMPEAHREQFLALRRIPKISPGSEEVSSISTMASRDAAAWKLVDEEGNEPSLDECVGDAKERNSLGSVEEPFWQKWCIDEGRLSGGLADAPG